MLSYLTERQADRVEGFRDSDIAQLPAQVECAAFAGLRASLVHDEYDMMTFPRAFELSYTAGADMFLGREPRELSVSIVA